MRFSAAPEQVELRTSALKFAREQLQDDVSARDRDGDFPRELWDRCGAFGFQGLPVPADYGGGGLDAVSTVLALEALGEGCPDNGLVFAIGAQLWSVQMPILRFGTEDQKRRYLPRLCSGEWIGAHAMSEPEAGSDAFGLQTAAHRVPEGYRLDGLKTFVSQAPLADVFVVFARVDGQPGPMGLSAFIVERGTPGLVVGQVIAKMGLRTAPMATVSFHECSVPAGALLGAEGRGALIFRDSIEWERACILAGAVGGMARLLESSLAYARARHQFGRPIASFASVANRLVDMKVRLEQSRLAVYRAAWEKEQGLDAATASAIAKLVVSDAYRHTALDAMEIRGGHGYAVAGGVEREVRDALGSSIYSGTSDIQRLVIARTLGLRLG